MYSGITIVVFVLDAYVELTFARQIMDGLILTMKKCMFCHNRIYFWQDSGRIVAQDTHPYAKLIRMDYEDVHYHASCYFRSLDNDEIPRTVEISFKVEI